LIRLKSIHHVRVRVPDVDASERFALDFGLTVARRDADRVFLRGTGVNAYAYVAEKGPATELAAVAFVVESPQDLENAVADHGATPPRQLDGPGGGTAVTIHDPDGNPIDLIFGVAEVEPLPMRSDIRYNTGLEKIRRGQRQHMPDPGPAQVMRLGHVGLFVTDYRRSLAWYGDTLGLILSDGVHLGPEEKALVGFLRMNRGGEWVDHHSIALFVGAKPGVQHLSFEVLDFEAQALAHGWMIKRGWESLWGMGRHELGSHLFDIWWEPNDLRFETFTDTDLCTEATPSLMVQASDSLTRWGPAMPADYVLPRGSKGFASTSS
jgi:catechol 2,3-dioxygenase-like lactoylglutathione lyase family enzyme